MIGGMRQKMHFLCMDLPQSDACSSGGKSTLIGKPIGWSNCSEIGRNSGMSASGSTGIPARAIVRHVEMWLGCNP